MKRVLTTLAALTAIAIGQTESWVYRYNGSGNGDDVATSLVAGSDGNIYAAGVSTGSGTGYDFMVISLTPADSERWVYRYNGPGNGDDAAYSLVFGPDSNIYAVGSTADSVTGTDLTVISLTPAGSERWVHRYNGPGNGADGATSLVFGPDSNLYAVGSSTGSGTGSDFTVISLTPADSERWVYRYNGPGNDYDVGWSLVFGQDGNIYATGSSTGSGTAYDFTVISLTPAGSERWVYRYNGQGNSGDVGFSLICGADGNIYAAGSTSGSGTSSDFTVISLTPSDSERWVYRYNGPGNKDDQVKALVCGADGNIYAAGLSEGSGTYWDLVVISLTPADSERWVYRYDGPANYYDLGKGIIWGADGNVYAGGYSDGSGTAEDLTVVGLTTAGSERLVYRYDGPGLAYDVAQNLAFGPDGNVYAAGLSTGIGSGEDFTIVRLNPTPGVAEGPKPQATGLKPAPTIVRGVLFHSESTRTSYLIDANGRKVIDLVPGANDVRALVPGVYFIRQASGVKREAFGVVKVVVTR